MQRKFNLEIQCNILILILVISVKFDKNIESIFDKFEEKESKYLINK